MPFPAGTWLEKLPLIASDTCRDTIEGLRLIRKASVGFIKLIFLGLVFASAYILSSPVYIIIGLYNFYHWARRTAITRRELLPLYRHRRGQDIFHKKSQ
jgi:hypothetical protein